MVTAYLSGKSIYEAIQIGLRATPKRHDDIVVVVVRQSVFLLNPALTILSCRVAKNWSTRGDLGSLFLRCITLQCQSFHLQQN